MKVGIITFHRAINFGAVLQALALQKTVEKYNKDVEIIDYRCSKIENDYKNIRIKKKTLVKDLINSVLSYSIRKSKKNNFDKFCNENIKISKEIYKSNEELIKSNKIYDLFITGSDQVWDNKCAAFDEAYFLKFVQDSEKKNSYAASYSFGELPKGLEHEYKNRLIDYNNISVRENSGQKIFGNLLNKSINIDLDPTLLLKKDEWEKYVGENKEEQKYILIYNVNQPKELFNYAEKISRELGYNVIYITDSIKKRVNAIYRRGIGPGEFLTLFKNAEFILTNSFHGTVFSIVFEKKFLVEITSDGTKINHRSKNLLELLGLQGRILEEIKEGNWNSEIDYNNVNKNLEKSRENSLNYIQKILL